MNRHDKKSQPASLIEQVSPEFSEFTADLKDVLAFEDNKSLVTALLFKLVQERKQTNELISRMEQKIDELALQVKTSSSPQTKPSSLESETNTTISLLPEADQKIIRLFDENAQIDARLVKEKLGYKQSNAASQRLNALVRNGYLGKIQSGKKVIFVRKP